MPIQSSGLTINIVALCAELLEEHEVFPRVRITAQIIAEALHGSAVNIYAASHLADADVWTAVASAGEQAVPEITIPLESGMLGILARERKPLLFEGGTLRREEYAHVNVRRTLHSLSYFPLIQHETLIGAIEILSFENKVSDAYMSDLRAVAEVAGAALYGAQIYQEEHHTTLTSITRLTQLYDIEKVFSSTLEMDQLLPIIGSKVREMLECEAVNVWLVEPDESLRLMHQAGVDPSVREGSSQKAGEGVPGDVSDNGEPVLIEHSDDARLIRRNHGIEGGGVVSLIVAPIMDQESLVGVIEATNKLDRTAFDDDDLFTLSRLAESAAIALHNASLLAAERKVEVLETLVTVSHEITSTLDLDRVLQAVVNGPATVIPYERAAIALEQRGRIQLRAVSGVTEFNPQDSQIEALSQILQWASLLREPTVISQHGTEISAEREETRTKFEHYFLQSGMRSFHAVPLADEEGRVGVLSFESSDPNFLTVAHLEMIKVLASQATVALRNASLYKEVPFIGVLQPLIEKKRKFLALDKHRRVALIASVCAAALFLILFPLPLRVDGPAAVAAGHSARVGADVEGVVKLVAVKEGDTVRKGAMLAELEDWDCRSALAAARARRETALTLMNHALASNDGTEAGIQQAQADYWIAEVARAEQRLDRTVVRSPIDGVVATPHLENLVGHKLKLGETFADIIDNSQAVVDVTIDQADVGLLGAGEKARVKLDSFPARTFQGEVVVVSPLGRLEGDSSLFYARVALANPDNLMRAGMQGRGKISAGWHPAGKVFFRQPVMWVWSKLWAWFGW
ncbi:MAG TPA: efflux RND transporter periplasmic adaptor subunit [Candidatus Acidoferrum sp.]|nr:efflux RND transporter periplasmic adaptor subunit [Candidatus Acidoferrum sp.]